MTEPARKLTADEWREVDDLRETGERIAEELGFGVLDVATVAPDYATEFHLSIDRQYVGWISFDLGVAHMLGQDRVATEELLELELDAKLEDARKALASTKERAW